jgi:hypothetical protein
MISSTSRSSWAVDRRAVLASALAVGLVRPARAAPRIGEVAFVHEWASRIAADGSSSGLRVNDAVFFNETVATVDDGALHLGFLDDSELRLGSDCRVVLDAFVYDPARPGAGAFSAQVGKGIARFVTGKIKGGFRVRTPTSVIGVRGTDFSVWVEEERQGRTTIWVNQGAIVVTPVAGGAAAVVPQDETVLVEPGGTAVLRNAPRPPGDPGLSRRLRLGPNR